MRTRPEDAPVSHGPEMWKPSNCCPECGADQTRYLHWEACEDQDWIPPDSVPISFVGRPDTGLYNETSEPIQRFCQDGEQAPEFVVPLPGDAVFSFSNDSDHNPYKGTDDLNIKADNTMTMVVVDVVLKPGRYAVVLLEEYQEGEPG